jgi:3-phosphoshikimate 1-carboxyvinyltransferase
MNLTVRPGKALRGEAVLPGDKSLSHRASLFAALAEGESRIRNFLVSGVTRSMLRGLDALGVPYAVEGACLTVRGPGWRSLRPPAAPIDCGNSATTLRLLAGAAVAAGVPAVLDGSAGLRRRPMDRIVEPLRLMGATLSCAPAGGAPLTLGRRPAGVPLRGLSYDLPVASAQVKSCLLLAGLAADGPVTLREPGPSRDHTERMLRAMGAAVDVPAGANAVTLRPPAAPLRPLDMTLPGDFSSAAFLMAAVLLVPGSRVCLRQVGINPTRTGLLDVFRAMGADISVTALGREGGEPVADLTVRGGALRGTAVSGDLVVRMIDEFPALAVVAAAAQGVTEVRDAAELRHKESDRVAALCAELARLGVRVTELPDGFRIQGGPIEGGTVEARGDHRLAMSLALAGLAAKGPVTVRGAEVVAESFPLFAEELTRLGARIATAPEKA